MNQVPKTTVSHIGICTSDFEGTIRFYTEGLGFTLGQTAEGAEPYDILLEVRKLKLRAAFVRKDGFTLEILAYDSPGVVGTGERRPMNQLGFTHLSLVVEDIDTIVERIVEYGGRLYPDTRINGSGSGDYVFCTDPNGVRIELWRQDR